MAQKKPLGGSAFDALAKKLVQVPKEEADATAAQMKRQRKRERKKKK